MQAPGVNLAYTYDAQGIRQSKTENGATTAFLVDPNHPYAQVLGEYAADGSEQVFYTHGNDMLAQTRDGTRHYYHYDALGSTRALTDAAGALTDSYGYLAFGEIDQASGSTENLYLYTGEQYDQALKQYYLRAPYMDPSVGRFTQMDIWSGFELEPSTLHRYMYAQNDPAAKVDPTGYFSVAMISPSSLGTLSTIAVPTFANHVVRGALKNLMLAAGASGIGSLVASSAKEEARTGARADLRVRVMERSGTTRVSSTTTLAVLRLWKSWRQTRCTAPSFSGGSSEVALRIQQVYMLPMLLRGIPGSRSSGSKSFSLAETLGGM